VPVLRHEALRFGARGGLSFGRASIEGRRTLERIDGPGELTHVIYAATYEQAMQEYHDRLGWGRYSPMPGVSDRAYDQGELERQLIEYPDDAELRRLNGLAT